MRTRCDNWKSSRGCFRFAMPLLSYASVTLQLRLPVTISVVRPAMFTLRSWDFTTISVAGRILKLYEITFGFAIDTKHRTCRTTFLRFHAIDDHRSISTCPKLPYISIDWGFSNYSMYLIETFRKCFLSIYNNQSNKCDSKLI